MGPSDLSRARARGVIARLKGGVAWVRGLGEAAGTVDVEALVEQGLGALLDDVLGPAAPPPSGTPRDASKAGTCVALAHKLLPPHRAERPGCAEWPE